MNALIRMPAVVTPKDADGEWITNPNGTLTMNPFLEYMVENSDKRHQINTTVYGLVSIPWIKGLTYRLNYNYTLDAKIYIIIVGMRPVNKEKHQSSTIIHLYGCWIIL